MATIYVEGSKLETALTYMNEASHNEAVRDRNQLVTTSCDNVDRFVDVARQSVAEESAAVRHDVYSIRISFSHDELDANNQHDIELANQAGITFIDAWLKQKHVSRPYAVFTQIDGKNHLVHDHILVINPNKYGRTIPSGFSALKMQDLNDQVMLRFMHQHGKSTAIQQKLRSSKAAADNKATVLSTGLHKYGRYNTEEQAQSNRDYMHAAVRAAMASAQSRQQFSQLLIQQGIRINRRANEDESGWLRKDGSLKKSLSLEYHHTKARTYSLTGLTLSQIDEKLTKNARQDELTRLTDKQPKRAASSSHEPQNKLQSNKSNSVTNSKKLIAPKPILKFKDTKSLNKLKSQLEYLKQEQAKAEAYETALMKNHQNTKPAKQLLAQINYAIGQTVTKIREIESQISVNATERSRKQLQRELEL